MPETAPIAKVEAAAALGATVRLVGATVDEALAARARACRGTAARIRAPVRRPGRDRRAGVARPRAARRRARHRAGDRAGRRRRADQRRRDRAEVTAPRDRRDRRPGRNLRAVPGVAAAGQPVAVDLGADDRRRDRRQAPGRADAVADQPLGRRARGGRRGRRRRGDGVPARAREAGRRGRRRGGGRGAAFGAGASPAAAARPRSCLSGGNVDAGLLAEVARRHESQAGRRLVLLARLPDRPGRWPRCWRWSASTAPTCSTSSTSARESTSTCARPRFSWCSRRADSEHARRSHRRRSARPATPDTAGDAVVARLPSTSAPITTAVARRPRDATGRRARIAGPAPRSPPGRSSSMEYPVTSNPSAIASTPWWWCDLVLWISSPAASAASEPRSGGPRGRSRRSCRGWGGGARGRPRRAGAERACRRRRR